ncbi:DUF2236 domain-containing protein [Oleomonas cavernae]|uniref:DUF2236 domain-containing protein n=1 Tax=Oleomonas cavernae TaxID=2320859 RepID=A0A418WIB1_9PROT|nr:oxygenase MpaB family protein [Oleomonas cavernae]RJF89748.1 DUF2236 domain-containing protein [Oleomonas cavernae]
MTVMTPPTATARRATPGRVPAFPEDGIPPFVHALMPVSLPVWLMERLIGGPVRLDRGLREEMIEGLWEGDEPMDTLLDWMFAAGAREGKQLFEQALDHGVESVPEAPEPLRAFFAVIDRRPDWVDMSAVQEGMRALNAVGEVGAYLGRDYALMGGYLLSGFNEALVMTGALNKGAGRRFAETMSWAMDIITPEGMERFGVGFKSTIRVRMIHALVRRNLVRRPDWNAARHAMPINQTDMCATILANALVAFGSRCLGVPMTNGQIDAVIKHTRYVGWLMGVKGPWLPTSNAHAIRLLLHATSTQPRGEETSQIMAKSLAAEPLTRHYPYFRAVHRRLEHSRHLSISRFLLGKRTLDTLGVPSNVLPWYPVLTIGPRLAWQVAHRLVPGGYRRLCEQGLKKQRQMLEVFHAGAKSAAGIIKPDASHPAHV